MKGEDALGLFAPEHKYQGAVEAEKVGQNVGSKGFPTMAGMAHRLVFAHRQDTIEQKNSLFGPIGEIAVA